MALAASHGEDALVAALQRATSFRRFTATDLRAVLAAGPAAPTITPPGQPAPSSSPPPRPLAAYAPEVLR